MRCSSLALAFLLAFGCPRAAPAQVPPAGAPDCATPVPIAGADEPGERLRFGGRVRDYAGRPLARAAIVAYHTDDEGLYNPPDAGTRVPRLRAVAVSDDDGAYCFETIRPAPYPGGRNPAHIHLEVTAPAHRLRWVTFWFDDDPLVTPALRRQAESDEETQIVAPSRVASGPWAFAYDIRLDGS